MWTERHQRARRAPVRRGRRVSPRPPQLELAAFCEDDVLEEPLEEEPLLEEPFEEEPAADFSPEPVEDSFDFFCDPFEDREFCPDRESVR